jgi:hypothetical protein
MTFGEINSILSNINNIQCKLDSATGATVAVELRMRLIGELSEQVRKKLKGVVTIEFEERKKENSQAKRKSDNYWNCDLSFLDQAIDQVFQDKLEPSERQKIEKFRPLRNKLLHGDFVSLMKLMDIEPTGRQILSSIGNRNILDNANIKEALLSIDRNQGLKQVEIHANEVKSILEKLLVILAESYIDP